MPSWKKIITSGSSDASLASLFVANAITSSVFSGSRFIGASFTGSFTGSLSGSLFGTSSFATTASFATSSSRAITAASATSATSATTAGTVTGTSGQLLSNDNRQISPSEITATYLQFGFTSWDNNNGSPYGDFLHMRSYGDASGGNDNLVVFRKNAIGVRVYQQSFGSATAYSSYKDLAFTDATNASGTWPTASYISPSGTNAFIQGGNSFGTTALIGTNDNQNFAIETNGSTKVTVDTSGNVGIGNTSPSTFGGGGLTLGSTTTGLNLIINSSNAGNNGLIQFIDTAGSSALQIGATTNEQYFFGYGNRNMFFYTNGTLRMTISGSNGNVGIGTTTPTATLAVSKAASNYMFDLENASESAFKLRTYNHGSGTAPGLTFTQGLYYNTTENASIKFYRGGSTTGGFLTFTTNDGTEKVRIDNAGNVGIGITSPTTKLEIGISNSSHTNEGILFTSPSGYGQAAIYHDYVNSGDILTNLKLVNAYSDSRIDLVQDSYNAGGSPGSIRFYTQPSANGGTGIERVRITSNGNVGIGTTTPGQALDVNGRIRLGSDAQTEIYSSGNRVLFRAENTDNAAQFASYGLFLPRAAQTYNLYLAGSAQLGYTDTNAKLDITAGGGATIVSINSSGNSYLNGGNVGIGTASPTYKLDIVGASLATTAGTQELLERFNVTTSNNDYLELTNTRVSTGSTWETAGFRIQQKVDSTWMGYIQFNGNNNGGISFGTGLNAGAPLNIPEALRIVNGGNIGVRVTSPSSYLDIGGAQDTAGQISLQLRSGNSNANFSSNQITLGYNNSATYRHAIKTRHNSGAVSGNAIDFYTWKQSTDDLNTIGTQHVMSLDGPNVGIGVTSPTGKLHVSASGNPVIFVESDTDGDSTSTVLISGNKSGVPNYTATTLELRSNIDYRGRGILMTYTGGSEKWFAGVPYTGGGYQIGYSTTAPYDPPNAALYINSSKNIGIGTTTPGQKLDVIGRLKFRSDTSTTPGFWLTGNDGSEDVFVGLQSTTSTSAFGVYSAASWRFTILNGGNVGIGTTSPTEKLQVDGTIVTDYTIADTQGYRLIKPKNGTYITQTSTVTGAIKITYPVGYTNTMNTVKVKVYEYVTNESFTITFGGYNYSDTPSWYNCFAYIEGNPAIDRNFNVRFGYDGTYMVVYIGELSSTWSYPQVFIEEVGLGYSGVSSTWRNNNWTVGFEASAFSNVTATVSNTAAHTFVRDGANAYYSLGSIGIGASSPAYKLDVLGTIRATGDVIAYSDARVKDNVEPIENALEKVISLRGVSYNRKDTDDKSRKIGVIAQEVLPIIPEVVSKDQNGNYSVAYGNMVGLLIEAVKEQQKQIDELKYLLENKKKKK
jgi:hypothetical protein